jgi:hypothetical protein
MKTVMGLFETRLEARRTIDELKRLGIQEGQVSEVSKQSVTGPIAPYLDPRAPSGSRSDIIRALTRMGLSEEEADKYVLGIEQGYTLEAVPVEDSRADEALAIMRSHYRRINTQPEQQELFRDRNMEHGPHKIELRSRLDRATTRSNRWERFKDGLRRTFARK